ncbi:hypothetical protein L3Y34_009501 [Caenorhabditis briggsae]|uniref:Uncharacterized protein n=1 Tax=Caenorhabditis briggsae TaxID=6238 RepID=A0AAE9D201_CAEBR|nr:hypothetical protein L3Y34_009501 [Caenorhabditis briggsae]
MNASLFLLGFLIVICSILDIVGTYTPGWIVGNGNLPVLTWIDVAGILINLPVGCYIGMLIIFGVNTRLIRNQGFTDSNRTPFYVIAGLALIAIALIVTCIIMVAVSLNSYCGRCDYSLGYSAWLCVSSAILSLGIVGLSIHLARKSCCDC